MKARYIGGLLAAFALIGAAQPAPDGVAAANRIRGHVQFLASDELEGRDTGSTHYRIAAQYVASQFVAQGLRPGGAKGSWFLDVPFRRATHQGTPALTLINGSQRRALKHGEQASVRPSLTQPLRKLEAPLVFAGWGINDPILRMNDFAGVDARGKIAVVFRGTPSSIGGEVAVHLQSAKAQMAAQAGAVGLIELTVPGKPASSSSPVASYASAPVVEWVASSGRTGSKGLLSMAVAVSPQTAERLFDGSRMSLKQVGALARKGGKLPAFDLRTRLAVESQSKFEDFTSPQVIGIMPGSDPSVAAEHIVLMGHLDHLGVKPNAQPGEDRIYNGALDNASGIATMIEAARKFAEPGQRPRRSLMFMANAGEEKGLLGADYFAAYPTIPINSIVGLVNLDMPLLLYDFNDVIAFGAEHSTIARTAATAASAMGVAIAPDPMPQESLFVRSDHYRFVTRGVPSIFLMTGYGNGGKKAWTHFLANNYHRPSDDLRQPIDWNAGARFAEINFRIAKALADSPRRPMWYRGDYFGDRYAPGQPKAAR